MPAGSVAPDPKSFSKTFGFGIIGIKKFPELIPLVACLSLAAGMAVTYMGYALYQKADVTINKKNESPPWERVNPEQGQKLLTFKAKHVRNPELDQLRRDIGSYKY